MERLEFDVLSSLAEGQKLDLKADAYGYTSEQIQEAKEKLQKNGFLDEDSVTEKGKHALVPYQVRRAIFLAAGFGSRMMPITINTPKPLVRVHGKRILETLIDAVLAAGIEEIYIVRGYLGEQFELLKNKYPMLRFIDNPEYDGTGTISSFYYARELLTNAYVLESDLVVVNPAVIHKYHYSSDFLGTKMIATDDWYIKTEPGGEICEIGVGGSGNNLYKLVGISFWTQEDGEKLSKDIREAYESRDGKKLPMSFVPFRVYKDHYHVSIMPCEEKDVIEIDSFAELQAYDKAYGIG